MPTGNAYSLACLHQSHTADEHYKFKVTQTQRSKIAQKNNNPIHSEKFRFRISSLLRRRRSSIYPLLMVGKKSYKQKINNIRSSSGTGILSSFFVFLRMNSTAIAPLAYRFRIKYRLNLFFIIFFSDGWFYKTPFDSGLVYHSSE